jgi:rhodanese-related sulfurtransferase
MSEAPNGIDARTLRSMLGDGEEIAIIDVREEGVFADDGHLLLASNVPLSHLELRLPTLVPRKRTRIVVCDGAEGLAEAAAAKLLRFGYVNARVLTGGAPAWAQAGERLYTGVYVPSKAFGEYVHHHDRTPDVTPTELAAWKREGRDLVILDSRPLEEYRRNTIPGSIDCPSAELTYRVHDLVRSPETTVVVNCGGRTRAIIGAQALINAGLTNPVYALKDGTQGWHLAGMALAKGCTQHAPAPSSQGLAKAREAASRLARRFDVRTIGWRELQALQAEPSRTVYCLDVRTPEEFEARHLPGSVHAPGGQLVQATDTWLAVRNAIVVLVDDQGVRATATGAWLKQMGWREVRVLEAIPADAPHASGPAVVEPLGFDQISVETIEAPALAQAIRAGSAKVVDFDLSLNYRDGHIPGAWHAVRSRLAASLPKVPGTDPLVFTSADALLARFAAADAAGLSARKVMVLQGGTGAWKKAGLPLEQGDDRLTGPADDMRYRALDRKQGVEAAIREYLQWEVDLVHATGADPDFNFRRYP